MDSTAASLRKVFISYARQDQKFALRLARDLRAEGMTVWIDETGIQGGDGWVQKIEAGLAASTELLLVMSPHSRESKYVEKELTAAINDGLLITPLLYQKCGKWFLVDNYQHIDFRWWYEEAFAKLLKRTPPRRTFGRQVLIILKRIWAFRPLLAILALAIGIAAYMYFFTPSNTTFSVSGGDGSAIVVRVRNQGGRPSMLVGGSFKLHFGKLPIEPEPLVLLQPEKYTRIAGHDDVVVRLTSDKLLAPQMRDEESYYSEEDIRPLLAGAKLTLTAQVKESDDRLHMRSEEFLAERIKNFILEEFPDDVP